MNKSTSDPPRLIDDKHYKPWLKSVAQQNLDKNLLERGGVVVAAYALKTPTATASVSWLAKLILHKSIILKIATPIVVLSSISTAVYIKQSRHIKLVATVTPAVLPAYSINNGPSINNDVIKSPKNTDEKPIVRKPHHSLKRETVQNQAQPKDNKIEEQLNLFSQAKQAAQNQEIKQALKLLSELEERYPQTILKPEIELSRIHFLLQGQKNPQAIKALQKALQNNAHTGRKAQLNRILGDLFIKTNDCQQAIQAYQQTLNLEATGSEADRAREGIKHCQKDSP
ncbi:MAG: hypothetical protein JW841_06825 [Deltaproteobacteria bacterium]|nr:hypothetical protein [Deltaproteobacteria bacterium]